MFFLQGIKENVTVINGTGSIKLVGSEPDFEPELAYEKIGKESLCFGVKISDFSVLN